MRPTVHAVLFAITLAGFGAPSQAILLSSATAPLPAADGSDIRSCYDGACEISVSKPVRIPVDGRSGFDAVQVTAIEPNAVSFRVDYPHGSGSGSASPGGAVSFGAGAHRTQITVVAIDAGTAVIRMSPE